VKSQKKGEVAEKGEVKLSISDDDSLQIQNRSGVWRLQQWILYNTVRLQLATLADVASLCPALNTALIACKPADTPI